MWKQLVDLGKQYISLARKTEQHEADIKAMRQDLKDLREEVRALTQAVQQGQWEQRHDRDMVARDRENLVLRLENYLLRADRGLPPGDSKDLPQLAAGTSVRGPAVIYVCIICQNELSGFCSASPYGLLARRAQIPPSSVSRRA